MRAKKMEAYSLFGSLVSIFGIATMIAYAWRQHAGERASIFTACILLTFASATLGALLGLTFGIPKTVAKAGDAGAVSHYTGNTNFDQISDWLTKILVGAGLVELSKIGSALSDITKELGRYFGTAAPAVIPTIIVTYLVTGFVVTYLWARIYLMRQLQEIELSDDPDFNLGMMHTYLYAPKPRGFTRSLEIAAGAETLLAGYGRFWVYRACAYGQEYAWLRLLPNTDAKELETARSSALSAARRAIAIDPSQKPLLQDLWHPKDGSRDDDLAVFRDDEEFRKLLGPTTT